MPGATQQRPGDGGERERQREKENENTWGSAFTGRGPGFLWVNLLVNLKEWELKCRRGNSWSSGQPSRSPGDF